MKHSGRKMVEDEVGQKYWKGRWLEVGDGTTYAVA